jgi:cysteine desulfurase/selenocysteine lyase
MTLSPDIRGDFPLLSEHHPGLIYLDSAATALKPRTVIDEIARYLQELSANVHRSFYEIAERSTDLFEHARAAAAAFCGAEVAGTVFTRGTTEAINLVRFTWGREHVRRGDVVVVSEMEHHSNLLPWRALCAEAGAQLIVARIEADGTLDLEALADLLAGERVRMVAVTHVSNVLGTINPVEQIVRMCHAAGSACLIDGAQAVPHLPVDCASIAADFYVWSAHKAFGPTGIGVLHADPAVLEETPPFLLGGEMVTEVAPDGITCKAVPWRFEAGTPPIAEAAGLAAAIGYMTGLEMECVREHDRTLTSHALRALGEHGDVELFGPRSAELRTGVVAFRLAGVHPHDVAELLGRREICIRAGHHCAEPLARRLGGPTARMSFGPYTSIDDVAACVDGLAAAREIFSPSPSMGPGVG